MEHLPLQATPEQRDNLKKLADYLLSGQLKAKFDMLRFANYDYMHFITDCGTVGCAVGHGPYAGIVKWATESWWRYSEKVFTEIAGEPINL